MQLIGNILLAICILAAIFLFKMTFLDKPMGGDAAVGHAYVVFFLFIFLTISLILLYCVLGFSKGFTWLPMGRFNGTGMLALSFSILFFGTILGTLGRFKTIHILGPIIVAITLVVLLLTAAVLLNENIRWTHSAIHIKWCLTAILLLNSFIVAGSTMHYIYEKVIPFIPRPKDELSDFEIGMFNRIDELDSIQDIISLYSYADKNKPPKIRNKAHFKIKSNPNWEEVLIQHLNGNGVVEAFGFLGATEVSDKPRVAQAVYKGVIEHASWFRQRLRDCWHPSHVRDGMFYFDIRTVLEIVDKFNNQGVDFVPAVKELRAALDEKIEFPNPNISDKKRLDKWIKKNEKK